MDEPSTKELTDMAAKFLSEEYPGSHIIKELTLSFTSGHPLRLDVGAITENGIVAVEVKGPKDTDARLDIQIRTYSGVCSEVWLLASKNIFKRCLNKVQYDWKILEHDGKTAKKSMLSLPDYRRSKHKCNAWDLVDSLRINEKKSLIKKFDLNKELLDEVIKTNCHSGKPHTGTYSTVLAENVPLKELHNSFVECMISRDWSQRCECKKCQNTLEKN